MARCSRPTPVRDQGGVGWFVYCVKEIHLSTCTTNIFWLCRSVNGKAHQPEVLLVNRRDFSHFDFVFPSVTEVVFVDEGIAPVGGDRFKILAPGGRGYFCQDVASLEVSAALHRG